MNEKTIVTCALNGVLTNPKTHPVPVTPKEMAASAKEAYDAGASVVHIHIRNQENGIDFCWDPDIAEEIVNEIRSACPEILINLSTGIPGDDISGPVACLERCKPEMAAMNSGSLNYLKTKSDGTWAWKPFLFDNPVSKIEKYLKVMNENNIVPECECFDTGILRSIPMFEKVGLVHSPAHVSLVMGVASGMPAKKEWLPLLIQEMSPGTRWQTICIGRQEVWELHRETVRLGGHVRTGLEDTFYLENGEKTFSNGKLIEALSNVVREEGSEVASPKETRNLLGIS